MSKILMTCPCCEGNGSVELPDELARTLAVVPRGKFISTLKVSALADDPFVKVTAINNRLTKLRELGLVYSQRQGKALFWRRIK